MVTTSPLDDEMPDRQSARVMQLESAMGLYERQSSIFMRSMSSGSSSFYGYEERFTTPLVKSKSVTSGRSFDDSTRSMYEMSSCTLTSSVPMLEESARPTLSFDSNRHERGVLTSGILYRRRRGNIAWIERWTLGHFVLSAQSLKYYSQNGEKLLGEIDLTGCTDKCIEVMPKDSVPNGRQATIWRFALQTPKRRIILSAATEYEMNTWLRHLKAAINAMKHPNKTRDLRADSEIPMCDFDDDDDTDRVEPVRPSNNMLLRDFSLSTFRQ
ncbi:hypothetical protein Ae201684P_005941 [Aphanomyces euteiches]|uniref:PH domain-containing protein n=1 Tax=Aphanomyces euteiches TaxID=100861 RepID=A0A6G0WVV5_9STRA|nr:hypothetical protein Ae201684_010979 [Aphanomyces euteiches]KAH9058598.1 hypothetical protein Ae201684P_005941 [Aphanomyces euteiches]KAH9156265.1 hypothetical protein AeRB84_001804 [Aphanomyces euteiches]